MLEEPIAKKHRRGIFDCGVPELNEFLSRFARQNHEQGHAKTFVAVQADDPLRVLGYYTLCNAHVEYEAVPVQLVTRFPKYPIPAVRLARLAVDVSCQRKGYGSQLLLMAGERALMASEHSGAAMLLIDAKDEKAAKWYEQQDAFRLHDHRLKLVIPLASIRRTIESVRGK